MSLLDRRGHRATTQGTRQHHVPPALAFGVGAHLLLTFCELPAPLMLGIHGPPGEGKSTGLRLTCEAMGVEMVRPGAHIFENEEAGAPAREILDLYVQVSDRLLRGERVALVIEDIDQRLGRSDSNVQVTINRSLINGALMELADNPNLAASIPTKAVPILITANDLPSIHAPLRRDGRMRRMLWQPTLLDRLPILQSMFPEASLDAGALGELIGPDAPPSLTTPVPARVSLGTFAAARSTVFARRAERLIEQYGLSEVLPVVSSRREIIDWLQAPIGLVELREALHDVVLSQQITDHRGS